ncbi:MAG: hypothetical protein U1B82_05745 [Cypionkella sp.]|nr:hypothetical protein [Cypionkella sp.]
MQIKLGHGALQPGQGGGGGQHSIGEVFVRDMHGGGQGIRLKERKQRAQLMLHRQRLLFATARRRDQDRFADQRQGVQQVNQMLEQAGIAGLVDRRCHNQRVGRDNTRDKGLARGVQISQPTRAAKDTAACTKARASDGVVMLPDRPTGSSFGLAPKGTV